MMKTLVKILIFTCIIASCLCSPLSENLTNELVEGEFVKCEIVPEENSRELLKQKLELRGRVVFGTLASTNQFPYFGYATLYKPGRSVLCGSSLISPNWVVSAAHCLNEVYAGQIFFGSNDKQAMRVSQSIKGYIIHPYYNQPTPLANDISLVQLSAFIPLSNAVKVIQLPTRLEVGQNLYGKRMTTSGFGVTATGTLPRYLQYTYLTAMTFNECKTAHWVFIDSMICGKSATATGSSTCNGDSGGGLILDGSVPKLIGINSYVQTAQCVNDIQGFTRVDSYVDWISYYTGIYISW
jgi:secreted trypsin-like serine protease